MITLIGALAVLVWAHQSRTPWAAIGLVRPASWWRTIALGVLLGVALKLLMKAVVMPLLGAPPVNAAFHHLAGDRMAALGAILMVILVAGFGEELLWRGFLFERLGRLLGPRPWATAGIVILTSVLFGLAHLQVQGVPGAQQGTLTGLVFGSIYARTRGLPLVMITHAVFDVVAVAIIHFDLETTVAQWIFR